MVLSFVPEAWRRNLSSVPTNPALSHTITPHKTRGFVFSTHRYRRVSLRKIGFMAEESRSHTIITMCPVYARAVACLHAHCIVTGFLSTLGERFLARLYRAIAEDPDSVVLVALARDKRTDRSVCTDSTAVTGFVAGTRSTRGMYRRILHRHWLPFSLLLLPRALSPRVLKYIFETMAYGRRVERERKRTEAAIDAELLSIAVDPNARGLGPGRRPRASFHRAGRAIAGTARESRGHRDSATGGGRRCGARRHFGLRRRLDAAPRRLGRAGSIHDRRAVVPGANRPASQTSSHQARSADFPCASDAFADGRFAHARRKLG
jgi:hypothetical protein